MCIQDKPLNSYTSRSRENASAGTNSFHLIKHPDDPDKVNKAVQCIQIKPLNSYTAKSRENASTGTVFI